MVAIIHHTELFDGLLAMGAALTEDSEIAFGLPQYDRDRFEMAKMSLDDEDDDDFDEDDDDEDDDFEDEDDEELDDEDDPQPLRVRFR